MRIFACAVLCLFSFPASAGDFSAVTPGTPLVFPQDHGAHPGFRTEWWYVTGHLTTPDGKALGFQITFFRSRTGLAATSESRFAPRELLLAHAAISDTSFGKLRHDQKAARAMPGVAFAAIGDTDVQLDGWSFKRSNAHYRAIIPGKDFRLELALTPTRAPLLQGTQGFSQKGPEPRFASYYYSQPHLSVSGTVDVAGKSQQVTGSAWLDHEWSSEVLMPGAQGWDWVGLNLDDGGALMAFRIRDAAGRSLWSAATLQHPDGRLTRYAADSVTFEPLKTWRSPASGASYPVSANIRLGKELWRVDATMPDQELDSRATTGAIYWEGAVKVTREGRRVGQGYLELTGYTERLRF